MKICFLLLDSTGGPWSQLYQKGAVKTWLQDIGPDEFFFRYVGNKSNRYISFAENWILGSSKFIKYWKLINRKYLHQQPKAEFDGHYIRVDIRENWSTIGLKTQAAIKLILNEEPKFDYIVRTNASTYIDVPKLHEILLNSIIEYGGPIEKDKSFVSGWGIILNRNAAEKIVLLNSNEILSLFDDEAIGKILYNFDISPKEIDFLKVDNVKTLENMDVGSIKNHIFIRAKAKIGRKRLDYDFLNAIHKIKIDGARETN